jgi:hypothetical protein
MHGNPSAAGGLTNGKKKKLKKKKSLSITPNKSKRVGNVKTSKEIEDDESSDDDDDDDDESEPMDFDRAFGTVSDASKIEHMNIYQNDSLINGLNTSEGDSYFDLSTKIDLKTYIQPVLISSTINLNSLAAVSYFPRIFNSINFICLVIQSK